MIQLVEAEEKRLKDKKCENCFEAAEMLYKLNAEISLRYIGLKQVVSQNDIGAINSGIAMAIKKLRRDERW